ncbi:MAG: hypothetical protein KC503_15065 [Myxococcales bacterium]|nr:hypothetical protein [Myxococcales bacterium]
MSYQPSFHQLTRSILCAAAALALACGAAACGDSGGGNDTRPPRPDGGGDAPPLFECTNPGQPCNAHDECAINPICGDDGYCRAERRQNCDDGLDCTTDVCLGQGKCENKPKKDTCALSVPKPNGGSEIKCFVSGDRRPDDPCSACDPTKSPTRWTLAAGGTCDDGNDCTKNDRCTETGCTGDSYNCSDNLECTDDACDGKGGCSNKLKAGFCNINSTCYADKERRDTGCGQCDVATSTSAWTPLPNQCQIGSACYAPGEKDSSGCGVCDPAKSNSSWTITPQSCAIDGQCLASGATDGACGVCDPARSQTSFSPASGKCRIADVCINEGVPSASGCGVCTSAQSGDDWSAKSGATSAGEDLEGTSTVFTLDAANNGVGWQVSTRRAHGGSKALWYGKSSSGNYDSGAANKGSATRAAIALPAGQKAALFFWVYLDVETSDSADVLRVKAGSQTLWQKSAATVPASSYRRWIPIEVDLSALAGSSVTLSFEFDTVDNWANLAEGVFIDDVRVVTGCGT